MNKVYPNGRVENVGPKTIYNYVDQTPLEQAAIAQAQARAAMNRLTRKMGAVVQRLDDRIAAEEEHRRERRRRGR